MLELISIHIPKTAGRSFLNILRQAYGEAHVAHFDRRNYPKAEAEKERIFLESLGPEIKAIHGHFKYCHIAQLQKDSGARMVTWMREPVERVISNHSFFLKRIEENPDDEELQSRRGESLLEYAEKPETRNRLCQWTEGAALEDFFFLGLVETFHEDVAQLSAMLDWPKIEVPRVNDNRAFREQLPKERMHEREMLADWNHLDISLYKQAVEMRKTPNQS